MGLSVVLISSCSGLLFANEAEAVLSINIDRACDPHAQIAEAAVRKRPNEKAEMFFQSSELLE